MRVTWLVLLLLSLLGTFALGRWTGGSANARADPELSTLESFRGSLAQRNALERAYRFYGFLQTLSPQEVDASAEVLESWHPWLLEDELRSFMIAWTRFDAPGALAWARSRSGAFMEKASAAALEGWAFHDPAAARRALAELDPQVATDVLEEHLVMGWLLGGRHADAVQFIADQPAGTLRQRYTSLLTIELMREGPQAVIDWAEAIPDDAADDYKATAFQKAGNILASVDPVHAAHWLEPHLERDYAGRTPRVIARRWLELDPPTALGWLATLPRSDENDDVLRATLADWLDQAPAEAEAWLRSGAPAADFDVAVEVMIDRNADSPHAALDWAQRIHDPAERLHRVLRLARSWQRRDPEALRDWLAQSELPKGMEDAILNPGSAVSR